MKFFNLLQLAAIFLFVITVVSASGKRGAIEHGRAKPRGNKLFFRMLGAQNNAPILPKTRSAWTHDHSATTANTGMSDKGFTEFPFCYGVMDFTFIEKYAIYPRLISNVRADESGVNTADILVDHVYEPDGCVWGFTGKEFIQTFTATRPELVSITLLIASKPTTFKAALLEGGPGGPQIGPEKSFSSGNSIEWGTARWKAGQAPLKKGRTYGIKIRSADGTVLTPYLHSTGNIYKGGMLYVDGRPHPESDLALWIVEEPIDLKRAIVPGSDPDGWVFSTKSVLFSPRTPNIRIITAKVLPVAEHVCDLVIRIRSSSGKIVAGPKRCLVAGSVNGERAATFIFAQDEFPVIPGGSYSLEVYTIPHKGKLPEEKSIILTKHDIQLRAYGEPRPGAEPAIFNLRSKLQSNSRLQLTWIEPFPCPTQIQTWGPGPNGNKTFYIEKGITKVVIPMLWAGHLYDFKLTSTAPSGLTWTTPLYRIRMPRPDVKPVNQTPPYPKEFVTLAPPRTMSPPEYGPIRYKKELTLVNPGFEDNLQGWHASPSDILKVPDLSWGSKAKEKQIGINTKWGKGAAGFTHLGGKKREQVFQESSLSQVIKTEIGHVYLLAAMAYTSVANGPRGDTRVRMFAVPAGEELDVNANASQWYWTDGKWMRFQHKWRAKSVNTRIGFGFFRWRDLDEASAYVDEVHVYDLGSKPAAPGDPFIQTGGVSALALVDQRIESNSRVEGFLQAPPGYVITGIGSRAHYDNITTMWLKIQPLLANGTLGKPEELRGGVEPDSHLEAKVELPGAYIATGFGAGIAPEWDVKRLRVWARPLLKNGTLGKEKEFRGGIDLKSGVEKQVRLEKGRVLISAGLNCMFNDVNKIKASSARLVKKAVFR